MYNMGLYIYVSKKYFNVCVLASLLYNHYLIYARYYLDHYFNYEPRIYNSPLSKVSLRFQKFMTYNRTLATYITTN